MMNTNQRNILQLIARILLSSIFFVSVISKITGLEGTIQFMAAKGIPLPSILIWGAIITEFVGALALITGYKMKEAATLLVLFLVPATFLFHNFWTMEGQQFQMQMMSFMKNISIMGGLLLLASFPENHVEPTLQQQ
ncbi:DoxX family protein [Fodinibius salsisoli]|uniref:DoxX family protein n=1 Tax=Fodinibius salsisoli TaxID=2820877 RepID=A0ABT3PH09_9BACT|nr:DoxX family protein [Fodinibius salsisoli]MCW9705214.1 DoxX family protein [Fodinibius salsisoli]